ncbi:hypothetical protein WYY_09624 [Bacillus velezensis M27]|uniref:hypothetical protein n=1 Tax=Bacillus TaxID=1386 RepID=UPI00028690F9|nr:MULTISPECIES: hypothetical protein [Bacillus]ASF55461.1 hypothetical protein CEG11_10285 [Bacillus velezensis]EKE48479.1 hypothetical protein WYY_09624 [Bacillus velezensis M27]KMN57415.1 hypothetical protein VK94_06965 [Bacillus sp. LK7]MEC3849655.1 hypothetical protein [Bacillus velezensis]QOZ92668.1 hypothetical protein EU243_13735 [Bacillus velezensis]
MTGNRFVDWCNENNLNSEDETFLVQLSGAFCNYENDKAKEMSKQLFITRYGEELGISSIKGDNRSEYEEIIGIYEKNNYKQNEINIDELLQALFETEMMLSLKEKF